MLPEKKEIWKGQGWTVSSYKNRGGTKSLAVEYDKTGFIDYPILYHTGQIGYDHPEKIPKAVKIKIEKLYPTIKSESKFTKHDLTEMIKKVVKEERENFMNVNQHKELSKLLNRIETYIDGYTKGETKKQAKASLNVLYNLIPQ